MIDMRLQALEAKLDHLQLLEPQMQALYRLGIANANMLRGISLTIPELSTPSAEEFAATVAWPGAQAISTWGGGTSAAGDEEEELDEEGEDDA